MIVPGVYRTPDSDVRAIVEFITQEGFWRGQLVFGSLSELCRYDALWDREGRLLFARQGNIKIAASQLPQFYLRRMMGPATPLDSLQLRVEALEKKIAALGNVEPRYD